MHTYTNDINVLQHQIAAHHCFLPLYRCYITAILLQCLFVLGVLLLYLVAFSPFVRDMDKSIKHARRMLLLFPAEVVMNVPAIKALAREYSKGRARA